MSEEMKVLDLSEDEQTVRDKLIYLLTHWFGPSSASSPSGPSSAITAGKEFIDLNNQQLIVLQTVVVGTAAVGATMIIISAASTSPSALPSHLPP